MGMARQLVNGSGEVPLQVEHKTRSNRNVLDHFGRASLHTHSREDAERLEATAKRYRVKVSKIAESVGAEFSARQKKREDRRAAGANAPAPKDKRSALSRPEPALDLAGFSSHG